MRTQDLWCLRFFCFFPLRLFQPGERKRRFALIFILQQSHYFWNTPRNKFVDVAIKFPEQNTFGAAVYSQLDYGRLLSQKEGESPNDSKSSQRV